MGSFDTSESDIGFVRVDGLQRVTAIRRFIGSEVKAFGRFYSEYEGSIRVLDNMRVNINTLKTRKEVLTWYLEMNSGGTPHTKEEINKVREMLENS